MNGWLTDRQKVAQEQLSWRWRGAQTGRLQSLADRVALTARMTHRFGDSHAAASADTAARPAWLWSGRTAGLAMQRPHGMKHLVLSNWMSDAEPLA